MVFECCRDGSSLSDKQHFRYYEDPASSCRILCGEQPADHAARPPMPVDRGGVQAWLCNGNQELQQLSQQNVGVAKMEPQLLQEAMATFVRTLLRGICIEVLLDDGSVLLPETSLNFELTHLILDVNEAQRMIPLQDVESVATPQELLARNILTPITPHLDDRCCILILQEFEFVTFRFDTERLREYFAACLCLLIARNDESTLGEVRRLIKNDS
mmetsp:Transcript_28030/g.61198  ORF Transcript_28030/g.61198 Transcript_28030/m.61198 type:complete len:215 (-) Transcript_28030:183-827(-)